MAESGYPRGIGGIDVSGLWSYDPDHVDWTIGPDTVWSVPFQRMLPVLHLRVRDRVCSGRERLGE